MKNIVILSGAGISAESGIETFRGDDGLWNNHRIEDVASPQAWDKNNKLVLDFYNARRNEIRLACPNLAHKSLVKLEKNFNVTIGTQNIDDFHERAGSKKVVHLHGSIFQARSCVEPNLIYDIEDGADMGIGDVCDYGFQLRPNIVWFGEQVPLVKHVAAIISSADIVIIIGTSLKVFPVAGLLDFILSRTPIYYVDLNGRSLSGRNISYIASNATIGVPHLVNYLIQECSSG